MSFTVANDFSLFIYALDQADASPGSCRFDTNGLNSYHRYMFNQNTATPSITGTDYGASVLGKFASGNIGTQSFTATGLQGLAGTTGVITASLFHSGSILTGSTFSQSLRLIQKTEIDYASEIDDNGYSILIIYPSASTVANLPKSFTTAYNQADASADKYVASLFRSSDSDNAIPTVVASDTSGFDTNRTGSLLISHSGTYNTFYGTIAGLYTTWSYVHVVAEGGITAADGRRIFINTAIPT